MSGEGGGWRMEVSATRDVREGAELLLSYGERPNDDFFIHYGFVPRANPHDEVRERGCRQVWVTSAV